MRRLLIATTVFCTAFISCKNSNNVNIRSFETLDSVSYALGVDVGMSVKQMIDSTMNRVVFTAAVLDVLEERAKMTSEEAYDFLNSWFNARKPAMEIAASRAWLDEVRADNPNIQITESGLMYEIITPGDDAVKVTSNADTVVLKYSGTLKDGFEFDARESMSYTLYNVIPGWREGLKLVGKGGEIILWVPAELAYNDFSFGGIPPYSALKYEIKLLDVISAESAE